MHPHDPPRARSRRFTPAPTSVRMLRMSLTAVCLFLALAPAACQPGEGEGEGMQEREEEAAFDAGVPSEGDAMQRAFIRTSGQDPYGEYLVNREEQVLYVFTSDSAGEPTCYEDCAQAWPPYLAPMDDPVADESLEQDLLGTVERRDGTMQVTWAGWPLYFYAEDRSDAPTGQDVHSHGGEWYLMGPEGRMITMEPPTEEDGGG